METNSIKNIISKCEQINLALTAETVCFTGHRNQKLPWKFNEQDIRCLEVTKKTKIEIEKAILAGYKNFITGLALGFDMICAELVIEQKKKNPKIKLICALPCKSQSKFWNKKQKARYSNILKNSDIIRYITNEYTETCMLERNNYMLNNSSLVIALFNGKPGGTSYTLKKAKEKGLKIVVIKP